MPTRTTDHSMIVDLSPAGQFHATKLHNDRLIKENGRLRAAVSSYRRPQHRARDCLEDERAAHQATKARLDPAWSRQSG